MRKNRLAFCISGTPFGAPRHYVLTLDITLPIFQSLHDYPLLTPYQLTVYDRGIDGRPGFEWQNGIGEAVL